MKLKKGIFLRVFSLAIIFTLVTVILDSNYFRVAAQNTEEVLQDKINDLIDNRAKVLSELMFIDENSSKKLKDDLKEIDAQLVDYGAEFLSWEDVKKSLMQPEI